MSNVRLTVSRACLLSGQRVEAGQRAELPPADALELVDLGKAAFTDPADRARCMAARTAGVAALLRQAGRIEQRPENWPWMPTL